MKNLLILDIDETLIHSTFEKLKTEPDFHYKTRGVYVRPKLFEFMEYCFNNFEVGIWTSSKSDYAKFILKHLFNIKKFKFIWTRSKCEIQYVSNGFYDEIRYVKNLNNISGYSLKSIIMIDDTPQNITPLKNVIPILEYRGNEKDNELVNIIEQKLYFYSGEAENRKQSKQNLKIKKDGKI